MEKHGIGTDATHAEHIEKIQERSYAGVQDNKFLPGKLGMGLVEGKHQRTITWLSHLIFVNGRSVISHGKTSYGMDLCLSRLKMSQPCFLLRIHSVKHLQLFRYCDS